MTITYRESIDLSRRRLRHRYNMTITYRESIEHRKKKKKKGTLNFKILKKNLFFITIFIKNFQNKIVIKNKFFLKF